MISGWEHRAAGERVWTDPLTNHPHSILDCECGVLRLDCRPCVESKRYRDNGWLVTAEWLREQGSGAAALEEIERRRVTLAGDCGCSHLAPMLGAEPEGFEDLVALELLAGDPPR